MIEGFLTTTLNKGFFARPLDAKRVFDLYEVRCTLEVGMIRLASERATQDELDALEKTVFRHKDEKEDAAATRLPHLDETFDEELARLTRNGEFLRSLRAINGQIHFVRWIDMRNGRRTHTQSEHLRIVRALRSRDSSQAEDLIRQHISRRLDRSSTSSAPASPRSTCATTPTSSMGNEMGETTGAEAFVQMLRLHGVQHVFGLCGDTSLPLYDAFHRLDHGIRHVLCRDERSAAYMADAYARVTGKVGVCGGPSGGGANYMPTRR